MWKYTSVYVSIHTVFRTRKLHGLRFTEVDL